MLKPSRLAQACGITASTLTKFLNGQNEELRETTIAKIAAFAKVEAPLRPGFAEAEAVPFVGKLDPLPELPRVDERFRMVMKSDVLDDIGIQAEDVLTFDRRLEPGPQDIVIAQIYDRRLGTAETVVRQFVQGVLIGRTKRFVEPVSVGEGRAVIMGVLVDQTRIKVWRHG